MRTTSAVMFSLSCVALGGCSFDEVRLDGPGTDGAISDASTADASVSPDANPSDQACQPLEGGSDDFEDGLLAAMWAPYNDGNIAEFAGTLSFAMIPNEGPGESGNGAGVFAGAATREFNLSLVGERLFVEMAQVGNQDGSTIADMRFGNDQINFRIKVEGGQIAFTHRPYGAEVLTYAETPYDPVDHRFWQLRETGGTVYAEVGASANDWETLGTTKVDLQSEIDALSNAYLGIGGFVTRSTPDPGTVTIDNFNLGSSCPVSTQ